jgi:hypothetical protein
LPPRTRSMAISMISLFVGERPVVSRSRTQ